mgnify:CR=1 FL=1
MNLQEAIELANEVHFDAVDKGGEPYFLHLVRVASKMDTDEERIVAYLHDALEDGHVSIADLPAESLAALDALTRRPSESYTQYIRRLAEDPLARKVKLADLEDNMDLARIPHPRKEDYRRSEKYAKAKTYLETINDLKGED